MHNYPNPNDLDGALMLVGSLACMIFAGMLWIDKKLEDRKERERREIEDDVKHAIDEVGSEAYIHPDRTN